ncbi:2' O-ribose methyltransferase [Pleurotus ostreatus]|uniref:rRNA methyltransferase 2, mitochondrial n=1 Tax=Pleurotus ostreatus TaxID=5322 RepID=A0A8H7DLR6_PLEOS|nr:2' O-ribose methyltransferase [Pleurotus ostreatus]KAF7416247.1 2' O-ribose methyltransferase [Pleurotus ostreatus]
MMFLLCALKPVNCLSFASELKQAPTYFDATSSGLFMLFRATPVCRKASASSKVWLARQSRDPFVRERLADPAAYRSRSAFKLLEIDQNHGSFLSQPHVRSVVDLGAAPGGWSQVVAGKLGWSSTPVNDAPSAGSTRDNDAEEELRPLDGFDTGKDDTSRRMLLHDVDTGKLPRRWNRKDSKKRVPKKASDAELGFYDPLNAEDTRSVGQGTIIAVDLLAIPHIPGVHTLKLDFLSPEAEASIESLLRSGDGKVDVVLSDMAANMTGNTTRDTERSLEICDAVLEFTKRNMRSAESIGNRKGGVLLLKHFTHPLLQRFRVDALEPNFNDVKFIKPAASRSQSSEGYWLCQGWRG